MNTPLVSIIIPTYNRAHLIGETLDSILAQTFTNWECIVVDDCSTEDIDTLLAEYCAKNARIKYHYRPNDRPKGANACRNYGFELSKGAYILFLDSDDVLKNTCLENRIEAFSLLKNLDFVISNTSYYKNGVFSETPMCDFPSIFYSKEYLKLFLSYEFPWHTMGVLWKRDVIETVSFDEKLGRLQDLDFHISILIKRNYNCFRIREVDNYYRVELQKKTNEAHNINVIDSLKYFLSKYINEYYIQKTYTNNFRILIVYFLKAYLYPNYNNHKFKIKEIEFIIEKSKLFNKKELFLLRILKFLILNNLIKRKGIGMYRFNRFLRNNLIKG